MFSKCVCHSAVSQNQTVNICTSQQWHRTTNFLKHQPTDLWESALKANQWTLALWPFSSNARRTSWKLLALSKQTSHTFTSGVNPANTHAPHAHHTHTHAHTHTHTHARTHTL